MRSKVPCSRVTKLVNFAFSNQFLSDSARKCIDFGKIYAFCSDEGPRLYIMHRIEGNPKTGARKKRLDKNWRGMHTLMNVTVLLIGFM